MKVGAVMRHESSDHLGLTTNQLICALVARIDAQDSLFSLLALMIEQASMLPIERQCRLAGTLRDAADIVENGFLENGS